MSAEIKREMISFSLAVYIIAVIIISVTAVAIIVLLVVDVPVTSPNIFGDGNGALGVVIGFATLCGGAIGVWLLNRRTIALERANLLADQRLSIDQITEAAKLFAGGSDVECAAASKMMRASLEKHPNLIDIVRGTSAMFFSQTSKTMYEQHMQFLPGQTNVYKRYKRRFEPKHINALTTTNSAAMSVFELIMRTFAGKKTRALGYIYLCRTNLRTDLQNAITSHAVLVDNNFEGERISNVSLTGYVAGRNLFNGYLVNDLALEVSCPEALRPHKAPRILFHNCEGGAWINCNYFEFQKGKVTTILIDSDGRSKLVGVTSIQN